MIEKLPITDNVSISLIKGDGGTKQRNDIIRATGKVHVAVYGSDGLVKEERQIDNLVVNAGKAYIASMLQNAGVTASVLTVSNATNSSGLILVQTSAPHGLQTGQNVFTYDVGGTVEANGFWVVTRVSSTTFTLNGSTFTNAYTSGGSVAPGLAEMQWMAVGTGVTGAAGTDTDLQSEISTGLTSRVTITRTNPSSQSVQYSATWSAGQATNGAITEAGIFNDSVLGPTSGTMLARTTFAAIAKGASDTLVINWTVSIS